MDAGRIGLCIVCAGMLGSCAVASFWIKLIDSSKLNYKIQTRLRFQITKNIFGIYLIRKSIRISRENLTIVFVPLHVFDYEIEEILRKY